MPNKAHRAASRQAQAQQRSKKRRAAGKGRPQAVDAGPLEAREPIAAITTATAVQEPPAEPAARAEAPAPRPVASTAAPAAVRSARPRARTEGPTYPYLGSELKQIGVILSLIIVLIVALSFVLR